MKSWQRIAAFGYEPGFGYAFEAHIALWPRLWMLRPRMWKYEAPGERIVRTWCWGLITVQRQRVDPAHRDLCIRNGWLPKN